MVEKGIFAGGRTTMYATVQPCYAQARRFDWLDAARCLLACARRGRQEEPMDFIRNVEKLAAKSARIAWPLVKLYNAKFERPSPKPDWAPAPLLKRRERSFPQLGWPRTTDSLCPRCVKETRTAILDGKRSFGELIVGKPGEIKADIVEENGQIVMKKTCEIGRAHV